MGSEELTSNRLASDSRDTRLDRLPIGIEKLEAHALGHGQPSQVSCQSIVMTPSIAEMPLDLAEPSVRT